MKQDLQWGLSAINAALEQYLANGDGVVEQAMRYSVAAGGKRIRPALTLEFCRLCGGDPMAALPFACAVEMIHTSSLIHDDLPCMDDDDLRRGQPSCHKKFGEANALLAGDALILRAFEVLLSADLAPERRTKAGVRLAEATGVFGMIGGQTMDLENETREIDAARLRETDKLKTGALIRASCEFGCIAAGAGEEELSAAAAYAENIGLAFQIVDDILDVTADEAQLGKPIGSDAAQGKQTYVTLYGLEEAKQQALEATERAKAALAPFGEKADGLRTFADSLLERKF